MSPTQQRIQYLLEEKVRLLTANQVARCWFQNTKHPVRSALSSLRALARRGVVTLSSAMLHPELDVSFPLLDWRPGNEEPDFGRLAWKAKARFQSAPRRTRIVQASAGNQANGLIRASRCSELQHDVMVASILLHYLTLDSQAADNWTHEDLLQGTLAQHAKRPDAVYETDAGPVLIECAGSYAKSKLSAIHAAFGDRPYRLY